MDAGMWWTPGQVRWLQRDHAPSPNLPNGGRNLGGDFARQEADGADARDQSVAGLGMQMSGPDTSLRRLRTAGEQSCGNAREHVART